MYTENQLYAIANAEFNKLPGSYREMREDAIAEFVAAAVIALEKPKANRAFQVTRGKGAMLDFLRREIRYANRHTRESILQDHSANDRQFSLWGLPSNAARGTLTGAGS